MKMQNITRLLVTRLRGEHHGDNSLAQRQLVASKASKTPKAQAAAEIAAFKRNISKLNKRQLEQLHTRLTARLGKLSLQKIMREARQ
jgi:hypothetical protein